MTIEAAPTLRRKIPNCSKWARRMRESAEQAILMYLDEAQDQHERDLRAIGLTQIIGRFRVKAAAWERRK